MRSVILYLVICLTVLFVILHGIRKAEAELIIDTVSIWNGTSEILGGSLRAVGETFTVEDPNTVLESFTLYVAQRGEFVQPFTFRVMEWNGFVATGPVLFESSSQINGPAGPDPFTFDVGGLQLTAGKEYVAFVDIGPIPTGELSFFGTALISGRNPYPNGDFVAANFGQDLTSDTWYISPNGADPSTSTESEMAFIAIFSSEPPQVITVSIDIKPGSADNPIDPKGSDVIPVAILTTDTFNATTVDPLSVEFGPNGATEVHGRGHIEDANKDRRLDLVLHFNTQDTGIQCGDTSASLNGQTFSGMEIEGTDAITTKGCK